MDRPVYQMTKIPKIQLQALLLRHVEFLSHCNRFYFQPKGRSRRKSTIYQIVWL